MRADDEEIYALSQYIIDKIILAFGMQKTAGNRRVFDLRLQRDPTFLASICVLNGRSWRTVSRQPPAGWLVNGCGRAGAAV